MHQIDLQPDDNLASQLDLHHSHINNVLQKDGAVLLRGTGISQACEFAQAGQKLVRAWMPYQDRASKRSTVDGPILTSTDTPPGFTIVQHSESAFTNRWPGRLLFCCTVPAQQGGATPVADTRRILHSMDAELVARFRHTGVMYVRNFSAGVGMDWRDVFQVDTAQQLEDYAAEANIALEWLPDEGVRTTQVRPAIIRHPQTGEEVWFNHALALSQYALDDTLRQHLLRQVGSAGLPHNTFFGDGSPISHAQYQQILAAHDTHTQRFDWQAGDILLLDNMLSTHGRDPFSGERVVLAGLADPITWSEVGLQVNMPQHTAQFETSAQVEQPAQMQQDGGGQAAVNISTFLAWVANQYTESFDLEADLSGSFIDMGGDSVMAVELLDAANEEFALDYSLDDFLDAESVTDFFAGLLAPPN